MADSREGGAPSAYLSGPELLTHGQGAELLSHGAGVREASAINAGKGHRAESWGVQGHSALPGVVSPGAHFPPPTPFPDPTVARHRAPPQRPPAPSVAPPLHGRGGCRHKQDTAVHRARGRCGWGGPLG
ncbi:hypothetical protein chiPu_0022818 [Chiloscyllium punctatum]|uniref:Uncharacterized protein n=1 Tax=Chiloscyllium punctatum TaxID=137246 RepID=A0A401T8Q5_CHIPU|nr:hypothetical protein [Chiloscyllium punctatum]